MASLNTGACVATCKGLFTASFGFMAPLHVYCSVCMCAILCVCLTFKIDIWQ